MSGIIPGLVNQIPMQNRNLEDSWTISSHQLNISSSHQLHFHYQKLS